VGLLGNEGARQSKSGREHLFFLQTLVDVNAAFNWYQTEQDRVVEPHYRHHRPKREHASTDGTAKVSNCSEGASTMEQKSYPVLLVEYTRRFSEMPPSILTEEGASMLMVRALKRGKPITYSDLTECPKPLDSAA
jgi:hypothetical protein